MHITLSYDERLERLSQQIIEIDEITMCVSLLMSKWHQLNFEINLENGRISTESRIWILLGKFHHKELILRDELCSVRKLFFIWDPGFELWLVISQWEKIHCSIRMLSPFYMNWVKTLFEVEKDRKTTKRRTKRGSIYMWAGASKDRWMVAPWCDGWLIMWCVLTLG